MPSPLPGLPEARARSCRAQDDRPDIRSGPSRQIRDRPGRARRPEGGPDVAGRSCRGRLPVFPSADDGAARLLLELVLRLVLLGLDGVEHLLLFLGRDPDGNGLRSALVSVVSVLAFVRVPVVRIALVGVVRTVRLLRRVSVAVLLAVLPLSVVLVRIVLAVRILPVRTVAGVLIPVLILVLVLILVAAAVLVLVQQAFGVGVVVFGLLVRRIQPQRLLVALERLL